MDILTQTETNILSRIQKDWRITKTPFKDLAIELGTEENELIRIIEKFKKEGIIRDISAIFNTEALGYKSALIAFMIRNEINNAAAIISSHKGVSHNYLRDHKFNIWFTLAVEPDTDIEKETQALAERSKATDYLILRSEILLKIGLDLQIGNPDNESIYAGNHDFGMKMDTPYIPLSNREKEAVYLLQTDLPLTSRPFLELTKDMKTGFSEEDIVRIARNLKDRGIMRRYSAILKHANAGYNSNAMTAWKAEITDDKFIDGFLKERNISHLYFRTIYPDKWEHGLFAMIHARSETELHSIIKRLEKESGIRDYLVLHSIKEFKKKRVRYFA